MVKRWCINIAAVHGFDRPEAGLVQGEVRHVPATERLAL